MPSPPQKTWPLCSPCDASALLPHGLEQHNCNRCSQVQTSRPVHRDSDAVINVGSQQIIGEPLRFAAKHEEIIFLKLYVVVRAFALCRQKKITRRRWLRAAQRVEGIPQLQSHFVPVIKAGPAQFSIVERKAKRFDEMQR